MTNDEAFHVRVFRAAISNTAFVSENCFRHPHCSFVEVLTDIRPQVKVEQQPVQECQYEFNFGNWFGKDERTDVLKFGLNQSQPMFLAKLSFEFELCKKKLSAIDLNHPRRPRLGLFGDFGTEEAFLVLAFVQLHAVGDDSEVSEGDALNERTDSFVRDLALSQDAINSYLGLDHRIHGHGAFAEAHLIVRVTVATGVKVHEVLLPFLVAEYSLRCRDVPESFVGNLDMGEDTMRAYSGPFIGISFRRSILEELA